MGRWGPLRTPACSVWRAVEGAEGTSWNATKWDWVLWDAWLPTLGAGMEGKERTVSEGALQRVNMGGSIYPTR